MGHLVAEPQTQEGTGRPRRHSQQLTTAATLVPTAVTASTNGYGQDFGSQATQVGVRHRSRRNRAVCQTRRAAGQRLSTPAGPYGQRTPGQYGQHASTRAVRLPKAGSKRPWH